MKMKDTYYWKIFYNDENLKNSKFHTGKFSMYSIALLPIKYYS